MSLWGARRTNARENCVARGRPRVVRACTARRRARAAAAIVRRLRARRATRALVSAKYRSGGVFFLQSQNRDHTVNQLLARRKKISSRKRRRAISAEETCGR
jgi:hypothetical protein